VVILNFIRDIPYSNLSQDVDCLDRGFSWLSSVPPDKSRGRTLN
jgi:hypothetical protein